MNEAADFVGRIYRPAIEWHFKDHPLRDVIMRAYDRGDAPPEQWDLWFAEAETIAWERLKALGEKAASGEATIVFKKVESP